MDGLRGLLGLAAYRHIWDLSAVNRLLMPAAWLLLYLTQPAGAMEHEEIVARLATGQCVPSYETRACRKLRRQLRGRAR